MSTQAITSTLSAVLEGGENACSAMAMQERSQKERRGEQRCHELKQVCKLEGQNSSKAMQLTVQMLPKQLANN